MTNDTATVETLTAEVRVLMVGNRQITLSMARQLDQIRLDRLEPFGRVRLDSTGVNKVIGRNTATGELAIASNVDVPTRPLIHAPTGHVPVCYSCNRLVGDFWHLEFNGRQIAPSLAATTSRPHVDVGCTGWDPNGLDHDIAGQIAEYDARADARRRANALPLIVLAGLR